MRRITNPKHIFWLDISLIIIGLIGLSQIRPDILAIIYFVYIPFHIFFTNRPHLLRYYLTAIFLSVFWQMIAGSYYGYNQDMLRIFGLHAFPLFAWVAGLFAFHIFFKYLEAKFHWTNLLFSFIAFTFIYLIFLLSLENIGYHYFDIHNVATAGSKPLAICNCLHVPRFMQVWYLSAGPLYFIINSALDRCFEKQLIINHVRAFWSGVRR